MKEQELPDERLMTLVNKSVDGLTTAEEEVELQELLKDEPELRAEWSDFLNIKETTDGLTARILADANIEPFAAEATTGWLTIAWVLVVLGWLGMSGYGVYYMLSDPDVPGFVKVCFGLMGVGGAFLLIIPLQQRLRNPDPYEEIDQ